MIWVRRLLALAIIVAIWQVAVWLQVAPERYFPPPAEVGRAIVGMVSQPDVLRAEFLTVSRAFAGLSIAVVAGVLLAIAGAIWAPLRMAIRPLAELMRAVPPAAIIPITIFVIGFGLKLYLYTVVFACIWPVYYNAMAGLSGVEEVLVLTGRSFGCSKRALMFRVVLPHALPQIFIGVRIAAAISVIVSVVTDMLAGQDGIGYLIFQRAFALRVPDVFALTLLCGVNGMLFNQLSLLSRALVIGWHERRTLEAEAA